MSLLNIKLRPIISPGIISAKMWIREGSRADPLNKKGLHQLLGALLSRGCGPYSKNDLADIVEGAGAGLRCDTYEDGFLLSLKCGENDIEQLLSILGWMICKPHLNSDQIMLEKELTLQALDRQKEYPFNIAYDGWRRIAYRKNNYAHDPLGIKEDLMLIDRDNLIELFNNTQKREKVLVIAGSIKEDLEYKINQLEPFEILSNQSSINKTNENLHFIESSIDNTIEKYSIHFLETQQVAIIIGATTTPHGYIDDTILRLLACHLGSGMSCLLFQTLREKYGVAYEVGVYNPARELISPFIFHASTTEDKANHTLQLLIDCWFSVINKPITEEELKLARAKFKGQLAHSSQYISQQAERKAHLLGLRLKENLDEFNLIQIQSISRLDIQRCAEKYLKKPLISICGPQKTVEKLSNEIEVNKFNTFS